MMGRRVSEGGGDQGKFEQLLHGRPSKTKWPVPAAPTE